MNVRRLPFVLALVALTVASRASAQVGPVIQFAPESELRDTIKIGDLAGSPNLRMRPNTAQNFSIYVRNDSTDPREMVVEILDARGAVLAEGKRQVPGSMFGRMQLTKPKPAAPPAAVPPVAVAAPPMPPVPPPPPGIELPDVNPRTKAREFVFRTRVTDDRKIPLKEERDVLVTLLQPETYVTIGSPRYTHTDDVGLIEVEVTAANAPAPGSVASTKSFTGPDGIVELQFPPQPTLDPTPREGVYRRKLVVGGKVKLTASVAIIGKGGDENGTFYVVVDGVPRTAVYRLNFAASADQDIVKLNPKAAIRLVEVGKKIPPIDNRFISGPKDRFPLRVEVDPPASGNVEVRFNRSRSTKIEGADEIEARAGLRHEQVWVELAGEAGLVQITTAVSDWVVPLDTRDMRGRYNLQAAVVANGKEEAFFSGSIILDDTPPDTVTIDTLPPKHLRGTPLPVRVFASDLEDTPIVKVMVAFAKLTPEGKLPEGVMLVDAVAPKDKGQAWVAQLPVPADKKGGPADIVAIATNAVGLSTAKAVQIQLIDPPTGGTIKGIVKLGQFGSGQAGITVALKDADGKDKGSAKTDAKGVYTFEDVPPGGYKVSAARPDAGTGTKGEAAVRVQAGKTSEADIPLTRKP